MSGDSGGGWMEKNRWEVNLLFIFFTVLRTNKRTRGAGKQYLKKSLLWEHKKEEEEKEEEEAEDD